MSQREPPAGAVGSDIDLPADLSLADYPRDCVASFHGLWPGFAREATPWRPSLASKTGPACPGVAREATEARCHLSARKSASTAYNCSFLLISAFGGRIRGGSAEVQGSQEVTEHQGLVRIAGLEPARVIPLPPQGNAHPRKS